MAENRRDQIEPSDLGLRPGDTFSQPRDRHADVGGEGLRAWTQPARGMVAIVARLPEPAAVLRLSRPLERTTAQVGNDVAEPLRLLGHAGVSTVEFDEQRWHFR